MWAGTEDSLKAYFDVEAKIEAKGESLPSEPAPSLLEVHNGVGVIAIAGPLVNSDSPWNAMFGLTSYQAISNALVSAAKNPDVKSIMLDINSPGGSVAGLAEVSDLIKTVSNRVKPVEAYASGGALSAAYWLASSADKVYASKTSMTGSIGVITTHAEDSTAMKAAGVNFTVIRAGKYKALASPHEPLSDAARAQIQDSLDAAYAVFSEHVAEARGMSHATFENTAGQGRVFFGAAAQTVGLIDGVMGFSEALGTIGSRSLDKSKMSAENQLKIQGVSTMPGKKNLTEADIAAIAAGAAVNLEAETTDEQATVAAALAEVDTAAAGVAAAAAPEAEAAVAAPSMDALTSHLKAELAASNEALITARVELRGVQAELDKLAASQGPIMEIVGKAISNMQVAMGATHVSLEGRSAAEVVAEHARLSEAFTSKFKVGGVAATSSAESFSKKPEVNSLHKARIAATHTNRKGA